jgi:predicted DCC family thiol-disulfide oxidoreductase YuxK
MKKEHYILFDGDCGFCHGTTLWLARIDRQNTFLFISNQSDFGKKLLKTYQIEGIEDDTIIYIENKQVYIKTKAVQKILLKIPYYKILAYFFYLIPNKLSDLIYDFIAKHRMLIAPNHCKPPKSGIKDKFILK